MPDDDLPVHLGELKRSGTVETDDGPMLRIETDQDEFLLTADSKQAIDGLSIACDMHLSKVMHGEKDGD